jgi:hypothetical protein
MFLMTGAPFETLAIHASRSAAEQPLQAAVGIGLGIDVRLDAHAAEDDARRRKSDAPFGEYLFPCRSCRLLISFRATM